MSKTHIDRKQKSANHSVNLAPQRGFDPSPSLETNSAPSQNQIQKKGSDLDLANISVFAPGRSAPSPIQAKGVKSVSLSSDSSGSIRRIVDSEITKLETSRTQGSYVGDKEKKVIKLLNAYNQYMHSGQAPRDEQRQQLSQAENLLMAIANTTHKKKIKEPNWEARKQAMLEVAERLQQERILLGQYNQITGAKKLGSGAVNTVWKVLFGDGWEAVWKEDQETINEDVSHLAEATGMSKEQANLGSRNIAMYKLDQLLGTGVIPRTERATFGGKAGTVMEFTKGRQLHNVDLKARQQTSAEVDYANAEIQKGLSNLQLLDAIAGQIDRHGGNIIVVTNQRGEPTGVKGIDNDFAFGALTESDADNPIQFDRGFPEFIDIDVALKISGITDKQIRETLTGLLTDAEIDKTVERFNKVKVYVEFLLNFAKSDLPSQMASNVEGAIGGLVFDWTQEVYEEQLNIGKDRSKKAGERMAGGQRSKSGSYLTDNVVELERVKDYIRKGDTDFKLK